MAAPPCSGAASCGDCRIPFPNESYCDGFDGLTASCSTMIHFGLRRGDE